MGNKVLYIGLQLTEESREELLSHFELDESKKIFADHVTLEFAPREDSEVLKWASEHEGEEETILVTKHGTMITMSDKVTAVGVEITAPCKNAQPHITVYTEGGMRPKDSNRISDWVPYKEPFTLVGKVKLYKKGE